jgi:hypothetical protein
VVVKGFRSEEQIYTLFRFSAYIIHLGSAVLSLATVGGFSRDLSIIVGFQDPRLCAHASASLSCDLLSV